MSSPAITLIGPQDHGRRMSLEEFDLAEGRAGRTYELSRGVITVVDVPNEPHMSIAHEIRLQLTSYQLKHLDVIERILTGSECKLLIADFQSERHPDLSVYKSPPPAKDIWSTWIPELVIEVVSEESARRDYDEKPAEYLAFGVQEYWIVDPSKVQLTALTRSQGRWSPRVVRPPEPVRTHLLPDFALDLSAVFSAGPAK
jgi:Uma2 family endonuclease